MSGPLTGLKVLEFEGIGPVPFACMLLADLGADVIRVDRLPQDCRLGASRGEAVVVGRGRRSIAIDLKSQAGVKIGLRLVSGADVLVEGHRPGVMERLGLGPEVCMERNRRLVYARMTGWGQHGPLSHAAGHDINYISVTGALGAIGRKNSGPVPPLNLLGDFGGGSMYVIMGILAALYERQKSGLGQVIDAAITDGVISLMAFIQGLAATGSWQQDQQNNLVDGGAPFYDTYQCADGKWISIGAIEPQFYALLLEKVGLKQDAEPSHVAQFDRSRWSRQKTRFADVFARRTQAEWCDLLEGSDVCFAPVLDMTEAALHHHNLARESFVERDGVVQTNVAPRLSRTPGEIGARPAEAGSETRDILKEAGLDADAVEALIESGAVF